MDTRTPPGLPVIPAGRRHRLVYLMRAIHPDGRIEDSQQHKTQPFHQTEVFGRRAFPPGTTFVTLARVITTDATAWEPHEVACGEYRQRVEDDGPTSQAPQEMRDHDH